MLHGTGCSKLSKWRRFATARALRGAESHQWLRRCRPTDELRRSPIYSSWAVSLMHRGDRLLVRHLDANWKCCRRCLGLLYICTSPAVEFSSRDGTARCERALRLDKEQSLVHITHTHTHTHTLNWTKVAFWTRANQWELSRRCTQWRANPSRDWDLNRDLSTFRDSIWTIKIRFKRSRFDLRFDLKCFAIRFEKKDLNPGKSAVCLPTQNEMHESSKHFCFVCSLMPKLYRTNWLADIVSTVTLRNISCVIRSKIHFVKYCYVTFYARVIFAAGAGVRKGANFLHSCATIRHEIASFSRSRRRARRMSALREIAVAEFVWSGPRRRPIPIAVTVPYWFFPISTEHCYPHELGRFPLLTTRSPAQRGRRRSLAIAETARRYMSVDVL